MEAALAAERVVAEEAALIQAAVDADRLEAWLNTVHDIQGVFF